jgi:hypothetical protein
MYFVLSEVSTPGTLRLICRTESSIVALDKLVDGAFLVETVIPPPDGKLAIPGELDRAIMEWNLMVARVEKKRSHINKVVKCGPVLLKAFMKWREKLGSRAYLLESLPADVEAQPFLWPTVSFGWLFGVNKATGEFHSDKVHDRAYLRNGNGNENGAEKEYLSLARRVSLWQRESGFLYAGGDPDDYARSFQAGTGISLTKWKELQERFNGGVNV